MINHFGGVCGDCGGIIIDNAGGNFIRGCYIGTDATGMTADGNSIAIRDNSFGGNQYGGLLASDRNIISGNANGIQITNTQGGYTVKDVIQGNYFGLNALATRSTVSKPRGAAVLENPQHERTSDPDHDDAAALQAASLVVDTHTHSTTMMPRSWNCLIEVA